MRFRISLAVLLGVSFFLGNIACAAAPPAAKAVKLEPTVAVFKLDMPLIEKQGSDDFAFFGPQPTSLRELVRRIHAAGDDENVKAVVLLSESLEAGGAQIEELRQAIKDVREKGKDVLVHSDGLQLRDYMLFSGATRLSVSPTADLWITGMHGEGLYLRGLLDKIGVTPDFLHCGAYKSAGEIFMRTGPSPEADEMTNWLFDGIYGTVVDKIAAGRKVSADKVKEWIDNGPYTAEKAKGAGLIDAVEHRQDFDAYLKKQFGDDLVFNRKYGMKDQPQLDFTSPFVFFKIWADILGANKKPESNRPAVGVVYVDGMILLGSGHPSIFGSDGGAYSSEIRKALDEAARDDKVKAVVLRIDSPGGSAVASEIILDATRRVKEKKPLIVSMGNVAGSGGYYVTCASDTIFADESTITASIGVIGGKLVTTDMWNKIGVNFKAYSRGKNANLLASDHTFTDDQRKKVQDWMDDVYGVFKKHVTDARGKKLKKPIDEIAGGRVYTGKQALELGLVDKIGTMNDAIAFAAKEAKLDDYDVRTVPNPKNFIEQLMEKSTGGDEDGKWITTGTSTSLVDLAAPYLQHLDPARVSAVRTALQKLQLLDREGVLLVMPEDMMIR